MRMVELTKDEQKFVKKNGWLKFHYLKKFCEFFKLNLKEIVNEPQSEIDLLIN